MRLIVIAILVAAVTAPAATELDSLVQKSYDMKVQAQRGPGYVKFLGVPTMRPERVRTVHLTPPDSLFGTPEMRRIIALEASVSKMSTILENLQAQSESNIKNMDGTVKAIQAVAGLLTAIAGLVGGLLALMRFMRGKS